MLSTDSVSDLLFTQSTLEPLDTVVITVTEFGGTDRQHPTTAVLTIDQKTACLIMDALQTASDSEVIDSICLKAPIPQFFDEDLPFFHEMLNAKYVADSKGNLWVSAHFKEFLDEIDAMLPLDTIKELFNTAPSHMLSPKQLEAIYGANNGEYRAYPERNWRRDAETMETFVGYWDWVAEQLQIAKKIQERATVLARVK